MIWDDVQSYDYFNDRAVFLYKRTWRPRKCYNTGKWIIGKHVIGVRVITGPGESIIETRWYHRNEGIVMLLKQGA